MTPTVDTPPGPALLPPGTSSRVAWLRGVLLGTWPGRLLGGGLLVKALTALVRLVLGREPLPVAAIDVLASVALIGAGGYCLFRLLARARRRLLWRVRRKLILSYVFIGVVPALLIVSFFVVAGLILFLNTASYLVRAGLAGVTDEAVYLARMTALEIQRGPGPEGAAAILRQRDQAISTRYPGASIALVPTGANPCSGTTSASAAGPLPGVLATSREAPVQERGRGDQGKGGRTDPKKGGSARAVSRVLAGPWEHIEPPASLPSWVSCNGFSGLVVHVEKPAGGQGVPVMRGVLRGVGLPDVARPTWAVIVDIPKNEALGALLREETSIKVGEISLADNQRGGVRSWSVVTSARPAAEGAAPAPAKRRFPWVAWLDCTDWLTGRTSTAAMSIEVNIADIYDRVSAAQARIEGWGFGTVLLVLLLVVALLFLLIEAAALVMGLALARSITGSVHELFTGTERVRLGDFSHRIEIKARDQLGELADSFNQMTASIEDLLRQAEEKKRLEEELRIAREIQMSLLPRGRVVVPGLSITALCVPAREVGGDYYDLLPIDENRLAVLVADVSGKGTSAALYMAELKGLVLSLVRSTPSPRQLMLTANRIISENLDSRAFITMTYAVIDLERREMTWARAGHTPLIHRPGGNGQPAVNILAPDGLVLGLRLDGGQLFERLLQEVTLPLGRGDVLAFFTDGISEAMNPAADLFGEARLGELIREHGDLPPDELRERILREIDAFVAGAPQHDDMTMILVKLDDFLPGGVESGFAHGAP